MNKVFLTAFVVFAGVMLLSQIVSSAEGKYSEARKKAAEREAELLKKERTSQTEDYEEEKKEIDSSAKANTVSKTKSSAKTQAEVNAINAAYATALSEAKANLKQAKEDLNIANRALLRDSSNSAKQQAVEAAEKAVEKAEIDLKIVILNKP
ncbi:hypothetical protein [Candidatus Nitrosotenuis sp. DW1]|uniref:hypothetical protein n=1 Tax=Candidatus Nitrosotenuis sp. DW1 TaxID=2259672 RepID=UPI0015CE2D2F|nr:hypothetical protein [Candidatus Nitrosotenuis sp. DW1]QLH08301.1 hypothetical protein DSQ19_01340 [Candidatus Nitrosotenuis sp. DW1]